MANINKVGLNLGQKIANPFRTSRSMSTPNPFKYSNFEGNTLPFADVFEGFDKKDDKKSGIGSNISFRGMGHASLNKMKMISSSVAGSMNKIRSSFEPIVNFVNRMRDGISNAWNYAKNTDVMDFGKSISNSVSNSVSDIKNNISSKISSINSDVTGIGKNLSEKWSSLISKIHHNKITKDTSPAELRDMWLNEIAMSSKEVA